MKIHLQNDLNRLKKDLMILCSMVEGSVRNAVSAVTEIDLAKAERVINNDIIVDRKEIEIEEECLKILALHQPVAVDLRYVIACLKVNNDLERIGDLGVNIATRVIDIAKAPMVEHSVDFVPMMKKTQNMLKGAIDALINMDQERAREIIKQDQEVDCYNSKMFKDLSGLIKKNPAKIDYYLNLISVSRNLERIADYATNICEDIVYMVTGNIVRHSGGKNLKTD